ncbi:MAG: VOC family protein [Bacteroidales bacterium]|nr:VOC family protein [Bacteroidales bacterium]
MESLTINLFVKDIDKSIDFYNILGFNITMAVPEEGNPVWVMLNNGNVAIMLQSLDSIGNELPGINCANGGGPLLFYIKMKELQFFYENIKDKVSVVKTPELTFYGAKEFTIKDLDGFYLTFAEDEK